MELEAQRNSDNNIIWNEQAREKITDIIRRNKLQEVMNNILNPCSDNSNSIIFKLHYFSFVPKETRVIRLIRNQ